MKTAYSFDDVVLVPEYSTVLSRGDVDTRVYLGAKCQKFSVAPIKLGIPVIGAPMDTVCGVDMCVALHQKGGLGILHRYNTLEDQMRLVVQIREKGAQLGLAVAATGNYEERAVAAAKLGVRVICVDIAHGDHLLMERAVGRLTSNPNLQNCYVIAGNVATPEAAKRLAKAGAHCVRTSVSSGSVCSTRVVTGFGLPTLQAVIDIAEVVHSCGLPVDILADGGIRTSGDAVKCLVAGADVVMLGSYLAGTDEVPGTPTHGENGQKYKTFRGMASSIAYQNLNPDKKVTSEGISVEIPVKGPVGPILDDFMGGIRSGCSYAGVAKMVDLYQAAEFRLVTNNGHQEGLPHILNTKGVDTDSKGW